MKYQSTDGRTIEADKVSDPASQSYILVTEDGEKFRPAPHGVNVIPLDPKPVTEPTSSTPDPAPVVETPEEAAAAAQAEAEALAAEETAPEPEAETPEVTEEDAAA